MDTRKNQTQKRRHPASNRKNGAKKLHLKIFVESEVLKAGMRRY